ncbi:hypothetical protein COLO4_19136 [Corchorus olitorius]|uniref:Uncharacterized protein n=1 Tax=Corchorus olitorius TaxID=93759 RepID=A0A1R3J6N9_9ROSI|nr:hypothetical protein COLO4_19136 [Corchorus olitorius]
MGSATIFSIYSLVDGGSVGDGGALDDFLDPDDPEP